MAAKTPGYRIVCICHVSSRDVEKSRWLAAPHSLILWTSIHTASRKGVMIERSDNRCLILSQKTGRDFNPDSLSASAAGIDTQPSGLESRRTHCEGTMPPGIILISPHILGRQSLQGLSDTMDSTLYLSCMSRHCLRDFKVLPMQQPFGLCVRHAQRTRTPIIPNCKKCNFR